MSKLKNMLDKMIIKEMKKQGVLKEEKILFESARNYSIHDLRSMIDAIFSDPGSKFIDGEIDSNKLRPINKEYFDTFVKLGLWGTDGILNYNIKDRNLKLIYKYLQDKFA